MAKRFTKYALFGAMRAIPQMITYEMPLILLPQDARAPSSLIDRLLT